MGQLFPRDACLISVLEEIDHPELEALWAEDETIGWMYQYYNDPDERKKMRKASVAPRNSRELAVRNQFFTPRYVVEFLTDNTLGRIWYEMTKGQTRLAEECRYLVRRPVQVFLEEDQAEPARPKREELTQEELLKEPEYVAYRALKDPREIRFLDPACGSMHFGLYAFDLYETIYEESWDNGSCPDLKREYEAKDEFLRAVPRLIVENNLHGIDIDPRAVQIAGLSIWLRAQKAWQAQEVKAVDRPRIRRSNIVCAEPMPGSHELLNSFVATLRPSPLGELVRSVFQKMQLAGEAGSLLKIEEEIRTDIDVARQAWEKLESKPKELFSVDELNRITAQSEMSLVEKAVIADHQSLGTSFWDTVEQQVIDALRAYADQADASGYQRRLFAEDAARGFAFIDICNRLYDAVVMNPPFGSFSKQWIAPSKIAYPSSCNDILGAFVERFLHRLHDNGLLGAITSRTCFFLASFSEWRRDVILKKSAVRAIADLGQGVMDDAMVEAAAYVLENTAPTSSMMAFRAIADADRQQALETCLNATEAGEPDQRLFLAHQRTFDLLPNAPFVYWIDAATIRQFDTGLEFEPDVGSVRQGLATGDDTRFVRTTWEVRFEDTVFCYYPSNGDLFCSFDDPVVRTYLKRREKGSPRWAFHVKSGASQPWYSPITLKINWESEGAELRNFRSENGKLRSRPQNLPFFYRPGFSWTRRAVRFYPYLIPSNCIPSVSRYMAFPDHGIQAEALVVCASRLVSAFLRFFAEFWQRPNFLVDTLKALPWPKLPEQAKGHFEALVTREIKQRRLAYQNHEPFHEFVLPGKIGDFRREGGELGFDPAALLDADTEEMVADAFGFTADQARAVERDLLEAIRYQQEGGAVQPVGDADSAELEKNDTEQDADFVLDHSEAALEEANLSYLIGTVVGRWDIRYATGESEAPELGDPFDPLPVCPPGMLQCQEGLPAESKDVPADYPLRISWQGILVDDEGHPEDIVARVRSAIDVIWGDEAEAIEQCACDILRVRSLRDYFRRPTAFFADHLTRYSKSHRRAPIYWPLSTESGNYTLWLYYDRLTDQTLYTAVNDYVEPKLNQVSEEVSRLRGKSTRSSTEEREMGRLTDMEVDLRAFRDELQRVAQFWRPNCSDGVQITAAPLWRLFGLKKWQTLLRDTWRSIEVGDYDWAHMAMSIWPERVVLASHRDRSYAIAHDLEEQLWHQVEISTDRRGRPKYESRPKSLDEAEVSSIVGIVQARESSGTQRAHVN